MKVVVTLTKTFPNHHPLSGEPTGFADAVKSGIKIHTCRNNYNYWVRKIESLKHKGGTLCIREWSGIPYRSPQRTIVEIPSKIVHISKLDIIRIRPTNSTPCYYYYAAVNEKCVRIVDIALNDGFYCGRDFESFFDPIFDRYKINRLLLAIIHFNEFNY